jgi:hypothetical protein
MADWEFRYRWWRRWIAVVAPFRGVYYGIRDLVVYAPLIWRDRDWDSSFMLEIWEFKLRRMERHFRRYGHHLNSGRAADQMRLCAALCKRIHENNYLSHMFREDWETFRPLMRARYPQYCAEQQEQDMDLLFKMLRKHLLGWWD